MAQKRTWPRQKVTLKITQAQVYLIGENDPYGQKIHLAHFQIKTALLTVTAANPAPSCSNHRRQPQCMVMTTQTPWPSLSPLALGVF